MPGNWGYLTDDTKIFIEQNIPKDASVLDIGCGHGHYAKICKDHFINKMDGIEIWQPYIDEYKLNNLYKNIYNVNILDFQFDHYDFIIMGDVLEHLSREDGTKLIKKLYPKCHEMLIVVPYNLPQGAVDDNKYEIHLQPDLSDKIMSEFYPELDLIRINDKKLKIKIECEDKIYYYCAFKKNKLLKH
jgi:SAM-dependent methyltransferase